MTYLLFDASAAVAIYYPAKPYLKRIADYLLVSKTQKKSFFYIPSFCIAEVLNVFAKYHYRLKELKSS